MRPNSFESLILFMGWGRATNGDRPVIANETPERAEILLEAYKGRTWRITLMPWEIRIVKP